MLAWEEDVEAHALRKRGWTISAIAEHLGRDRKTIRAYLSGQRVPGRRRPAGPDAFVDFEGYVRARFAQDPHVQATTLFDELVALGYERAYQTFTRQLRDRRLRPACAGCAGVKGRATIEIDHPPGEETQWDWIELPEAPWLAAGADAHLLVGTLPFSSRARAVFADSEDQAHLVATLHAVCERLGGVTRRWRFDRMGTVVEIGSGRVLASFAAVAKHYGVAVDVCPAYAANRKGAVEKSNDFVAKRWWRSADVATAAQAQTSLDRFLAGPGDPRARRHDGARTSVAGLAGLETLTPLPAQAFPAEIVVTATVTVDATVAFRGNRYSLPPSLIGAQVSVRHRLGSAVVEITTAAGLVAATHERAVDGAGRLLRSDAHRAQLERLVLAQTAAGTRPCHRKANRPPDDAAQAEAARLRRRHAGIDVAADVVVDLAAYARLVEEPAQDAAVEGGDTR